MRVSTLIDKSSRSDAKLAVGFNPPIRAAPKSKRIEPAKKKTNPKKRLVHYAL